MKFIYCIIGFIVYLYTIETNKKIEIMITNVVLCRKGNITTPVFHISEDQAKKNLNVLKSYNEKILLTFDEFIKLKGVILTVNYKKFHSVKRAMKAEIKYISKEYPADLIYYSNVLELCKEKV